MFFYGATIEGRQHARLSIVPILKEDLGDEVEAGLIT
jgi:hypothetical protein